MKKDEIKEIMELTQKINKEDYEKFLMLKGYMMGRLNKKKVQ